MPNKKTTKKKVSPKTPSKKKSKALTEKKMGGRITKVRREEILDDGMCLIEDGEFSAYSDVDLAKRWNINRKSVKKIRELLGQDLTDNMLIRRARWKGLLDRQERNLANMVNRFEKLRFCVNAKCNQENGTYEGENMGCPFCSKPTEINYNGQLMMANQIPKLVSSTVDIFQKLGDIALPTQKVEGNFDITQKQIIVNVNLSKEEKAEIIDAE
jgi:hypothetical protein